MREALNRPTRRLNRRAAGGLLCLGCIGQRFGTLKYDTEAMKITNNPEADKMLKGPAVRAGIRMTGASAFRNRIRLLISQWKTFADES
jgi:hypothetical protein